MGTLIDRTHRELTADDIARIAAAYHAWRGEAEAGEYEDVPGFCKSGDARGDPRHGHVLTPGRYVGAAAEEDDGEPFAEKFARLRKPFEGQFAESAKLEAQIRRTSPGWLAR